MLRKSKLFKYRFMKKSVLLSPSLPETRYFTTSSFWDMMSKYQRVIVKPMGGSRGRGVFQVTAKPNGGYEVHYENTKQLLNNAEQVTNYLSSNINSESYIVQRWIHRANIRRRPFDIRIIVQRRRGSRNWVMTGIVAKVAGSGYIVSNIERSKGTILPVKTAFKHSSLRVKSGHVLLNKLNRIGLLSARRLRLLYPKHRMFGLDVGVDPNGKVWIIEANLLPSLSHFRKLKNKTMLKQIIAYKRG